MKSVVNWRPIAWIINSAATATLLFLAGCQAGPPAIADAQQKVEARGRINCIYGNAGGFCDVEDSVTQYRFSLSEQTPVTWYFEGRKLPTVTLADTDIVIPAFEAETLTHFQDCSARVTQTGSEIRVQIQLEGCAHSHEVYQPILVQQSREDRRTDD